MASKVSGMIEKLTIGSTTHAIASTAYGYCETEAATPIKDVDMTGFVLYEGVTIHIKFKNKNSASDPKLRINSTAAEDAKPIVQYGTTAAGATSETNGWYAGAVISFTYDGTSWVRDQGFNTNTTYYYESCYSATAAGTAAKVAQASSYTLPTTAGHFAFWLLNSNTVASKLTLAIKNGSTAGTAKDVWINGAVTSSTNYTWPSGFYIGYYDGSVYHFRTDGKLPGNLAGNAATATSAGKATNDSDNNAINTTYLKKSGGRVTGDITLYTSGTGATPALVFQREDTLGGSYYDWRVINTGGKLTFQDAGSHTSNAWTTRLEIYTDTLTGKFSGPLSGNATTATTSTWTTLIKPIASTTTASASTWNIPTGSFQVWGERFSDTRLKYTPSGGSETTITDTGDWVMWLTPTSGGTATLNMRIDGTYYGSFSGNGSSLTSLNASNISSGTLNLVRLGNQNKNVVLAGPTTGDAAAPTFRALVAADIPNLSWNKITSDKPTTLSGYGITDAKIVSGVITLGSNKITPVTSVNGHTGSSVSVTAGDLNLSSALRFIGKASTDMSESTTTAPTVTGLTNYVPIVGDVILDKNDEYEYVCIAVSGTTYTWEKLGSSSSYSLSTHVHGNIQNGGTLQTNDITIANGDKIIVTDSSDSSKIARASISFDGSTTTKALSQKGTWETFNNVTQTAKSDNVNYKVLTTTSASPTSGSAAGAAYTANVYINASASSISAVQHRLNVGGTDKALIQYNNTDQSIDFIFA